MKQKDLTVAFILWFFLAGVGAHRIYLKGSVLTFLWYWLAIICTLSIIVWYDLFKLKAWTEAANKELA